MTLALALARLLASPLLLRLPLLGRHSPAWAARKVISRVLAAPLWRQRPIVPARPMSQPQTDPGFLASSLPPSSLRVFPAGMYNAPGRPHPVPSRTSGHHAGAQRCQSPKPAWLPLPGQLHSLPHSLAEALPHSQLRFRPQRRTHSTTRSRSRSRSHLRAHSRTHSLPRSLRLHSRPRLHPDATQPLAAPWRPADPRHWGTARTRTTAVAGAVATEDPRREACEGGADGPELNGWRP